MKKKGLKKILTVMLAAMTVSATPGLVGAMSDASKAKIQNLNQKIENNAIMSEVDVNQSLKDLEKIANEDDDGKVEVSKILGDMIDKGVFEKSAIYTDMDDNDIIMDDDISRIINILGICSEYDGAKENIAQAIEKMAEKGLLGRYNEKYTTITIVFRICTYDQLNAIIKILESCSNYANKTNQSQIKKHILSAISHMASNGALGISHESLMSYIKEDIGLPGDSLSHVYKIRQCDYSQTYRIMQILEKNSQGNEQLAASSILSMAKGRFLDIYSTDKILNMLQTYSQNDDAKESVAKAIDCVVSTHGFNKELMSTTLDILHQCSDNNDAKKEISSAIATICNNAKYFNGNFMQFDEDSLKKMWNILQVCLQDNNAKPNGALATAYLIHQNMFNKSDRKLILDTLERCLENNDAKFGVTRLIEAAIDKEIFDQNDKGLILNILTKCSDNDANLASITAVISSAIKKNIFDEDSRDQVLSILHKCPEPYCVLNTIKTMVDMNFINEQSINDTVTDIIQKQSTSYYDYDQALEVIETMLEKNVLRGCNNEQINKIVDIVLAGSYRSMRKTIDMIKAICDKNLLDKCSPNRINQIVDLLIPCLENNYNRKDASEAIKAINEKNLLDKYTPTQVQNTVDSLIKSLGYGERREALINNMRNIGLSPDQLQEMADSSMPNLNENSIKQPPTILLAAMAKNGSLSKCTPEQVKQIVDSLKGYLETELKAGNYENVTKIFNIFKACSEFNTTKSAVLDIINNAYDEHHESFLEYINQNTQELRLENIIDILHSCSKSENQNSKFQATATTAWIVQDIHQKLRELTNELEKPNPQRSEEDLEKLKTEYINLYKQMSKEIPKITEIFSEGSQARTITTGMIKSKDVNETIRYIPAAIRQLHYMGFFEPKVSFVQNNKVLFELENNQDDIKKLLSDSINIFDKCLKTIDEFIEDNYGGKKEDFDLKVEYREAMADMYNTLTMLDNSKLRNNLSPDDISKLNEMLAKREGWLKIIER